MKRIINGLLYDTDNAELIIKDERSKRWLYRTHNGAFFIMFATGELQEMSIEKAKNYLGSISVEKYIDIFGQPKEA